MKKRIVVMVMVGVMSTLLIACKDTVQEYKKRVMRTS